MTESLIFHINQDLWKKLLIFYINRRFYNKLYCNSMEVYILTNNTTDKHKNHTFSNGEKFRNMSSRCYYS